MRTCRLSLYLIGAALVLPCQVIAAPPTPAVAGTTFKQAVESAWQRTPAARTNEARQDEVLAARDNARSWHASSLTLEFLCDNVRGNFSIARLEAQVRCAYFKQRPVNASISDQEIHAAIVFK